MKPVDVGGRAFKGLGGIGSRHIYVIIRHIREQGAVLSLSRAQRIIYLSVCIPIYYAWRGYKCKSLGQKGVDYANWETKVERYSIL